MNLMSNPMGYFLCSYLNSCLAEQSSSHLTFFPLWPFKLLSLIGIASLGNGKVRGKGEKRAGISKSRKGSLSLRVFQSSAWLFLSILPLID